MHLSVFLFSVSVLRALRGKCLRVLEVGSFNVNGSLRDWILGNLCITEYVGVDIQIQRGYVETVADASMLPFRGESFDVVISTEVLEHVKNWRAVVAEMVRVLKRGGLLVITTRSPGYPLHSYPYDFWRYTIDDFKKIFHNMKILRLMGDPQEPGVFFAGVKIREFEIPDIQIRSVIQSSETPRRSTNLNGGQRRAKHFLKNLLMFIYNVIIGIEILIAGQLISMRCKTIRNFVICNQVILRFTRVDALYWLKSLARGSETGISTSRYLALRRRYGSFIAYTVYLMSKLFKSLFT